MSLDSIINDLSKILIIAGPHWPFFVYTSSFAFVGEVMKRQVLTPKNIDALERHADRWWNRKGFGYVVAVLILMCTRIPLALHPFLAGFVLGLLPGVPLSPGVHHGAQSVIYCMGAGMFSTSLYSLIRAIWAFWWTNIARKTGPVPNLPLPGTASTVPSEPEPPATEPGETP